MAAGSRVTTLPTAVAVPLTSAVGAISAGWAANRTDSGHDAHAFAARWVLHREGQGRAGLRTQARVRGRHGGVEAWARGKGSCDMRAVLADISTPRYLITAAAQNSRGAWAPQRGLEPRRDPAWLMICPSRNCRQRRAGSGCAPNWPASAAAMSASLHAKSSFVLTAFGYSAQRQVLGHEIVGVVEQRPGGFRLSPGDRVLVNPVFSCAQRGFEPACRACRGRILGSVRAVRRTRCLRLRGPIHRLRCARWGGGWGEQLVAHQSQLYPAGSIPSRRAVLAEPASGAAARCVALGAPGRPRGRHRAGHHRPARDRCATHAAP